MHTQTHICNVKCDYDTRVHYTSHYLVLSTKLPQVTALLFQIKNIEIPKVYIMQVKPVCLMLHNIILMLAMCKGEIFI